ncbi:unnamed protein product [Coffea canephora]|uniref:Uncharacterized protein n=1 Tax=Coffea canephora TaxID=49390 RepID=A0A068UBN7_COFCA|nr:unnamed protein product [Coffea canephora]
MASIGKIVRWVPQLAVLSHPAMGGFVSHCGWNSILESIWCGMPIATWPLFAEQQLHAFQLKGIRELMDDKNEIRNRFKEFEKCKAAIEEGGSSYEY